MSIITETALLKPVAIATTIARTEPIDLGQFFQNLGEFDHLDSFRGARVRDTFRQRFDLGVVPSTPARSYVASVVKEDILIQDILKELPQDHLSTLADIASFIEAQAEGQEGFLLTDGCGEVFLVQGKDNQVFMLDVYWACVYGTYCEWFIDDWNIIDENAPLEDFWSSHSECDTGLRIFCPGTIEP